MTEAARADSLAGSRRRRPGRWVIAGAAAIVALGAGAIVAIPLGGWDTVALESAVVPELAAGEVYVGRHYSVRVEDAWVGDELPDDYDEPEEGMTFVVVRAVLRNEWREPDTHADDVLTFDALEGLPSIDQQAGVRVASDGTYLSTMPPGVELEMLLRWEVPSGSVAVGEPLVLGVVDGRPDRAILYSGTAWRDEHVVVQTTVLPRPSSELEYAWES
jgi:hypothetical protein